MHSDKKYDYVEVPKGIYLGIIIIVMTILQKEKECNLNVNNTKSSSPGRVNKNKQNNVAIIGAGLIGNKRAGALGQNDRLILVHDTEAAKNANVDFFIKQKL